MQTLPNTNGVDLDRNEIVFSVLVRMSFMPKEIVRIEFGLSFEKFLQFCTKKYGIINTPQLQGG